MARVLIVDDDVETVTLIAEAFVNAGHEVRISVNAAGALAVAGAFAPDVAIIDLGLPGMDGLVLARELRAGASRPMRVIAYSGTSPRDPHVQSSPDVGSFDAFVMKPATLEQLFRSAGLSAAPSAR